MEKWVPIQKLKPDFIPTVNSIYVFNNGEQALIIQGDDSVWGLGTRPEVFGLPNKSRLEPFKINKLSGLNIKTFSSGSNHVVALTVQGKIYTFGENSRGQLGQKKDVSRPVQYGNVYYYRPCLISRNDKVFTQVASSDYHNLAVAQDGWIYSWGCNKFGQCNKLFKNQLCHFRPVIDRCNFKMVTCTRNSSFALTKTGKVYAWGDVQGVLSNDISNQPVLVSEIQEKVVTKIVGGRDHVLALCDDGKLFSLGKNSYGELGNGEQSDNACRPVEVQGIGNVSDVAASPLRSLSAAVTQNRDVYMWGNGNCILRPLLTPHKHISDVFAYYSCPPITPLRK